MIPGVHVTVRTTVRSGGCIIRIRANANPLPTPLVTYASNSAAVHTCISGFYHTLPVMDGRKEQDILFREWVCGHGGRGGSYFRVNGEGSRGRCYRRNRGGIRLGESGIGGRRCRLNCRRFLEEETGAIEDEDAAIVRIVDDGLYYLNGVGCQYVSVVILYVEDKPWLTYFE